MARTVRGARVLITGAASGMGLLYAERAVREGAKAVVLWDRDEAGLTRLTDRLRGEVLAGRTVTAWGAPAGSPSSATGSRNAGTSIHPYVVDLRELGGIAQAAQSVRKELDGVDVLVNNAGIVRGKFFWEHDNGDDTRATMQVNALAPMYTTREFLPGMISSPREARIVNIASAAGTLANPRMSVYAASKSAVINWSDSLRLELEQQGYGHVKVTTVAPSYIDTGMFEGARGPLLTPILTPEYVVDRVWRAMLAGKPVLLLPWSVGLAKTLKGVLPTRAWDALAGRLFGVYSSMDEFTGR
ncbi:SDR family NAD(P)-dependent oxidoreductase [Leifsonia shinshuensis]|uniref:SDR family NAD(P)-dependent oxidoreductase n=1 Tax=Leifsonia shinshuensis TaxID=150026 RepID=A0A7G6YDF3_9MICO|nr:SDR family NAD(P)-dependent oxidoreductase [Leifsonia shinshuensis]QNE36518.1 SDR family NAD(P)-dependent oxidoreductase [Leifsonia shinshuensis]